MNTNTVKIAKGIAKFVVASGTSKIAHTIIKNNVQPEGIYSTVTVAAGSLVIGSMVSDASSTYTEAKIDKVVAWYDKTVADIKSAKK